MKLLLLSLLLLTTALNGQTYQVTDQNGGSSSMSVDDIYPAELGGPDLFMESDCYIPIITDHRWHMDTVILDDDPCTFEANDSLVVHIFYRDSTEYADIAYIVKRDTMNLDTGETLYRMHCINKINAAYDVYDFICGRYTNLPYQVWVAKNVNGLDCEDAAIFIECEW